MELGCICLSVSDAMSVFGLSGVATVPEVGELRRLYRGLAKKLHPDMNGGTVEAHNAFEALGEAYELLLQKAGQTLAPRLRHHSLFDIGF